MELERLRAEIRKLHAEATKTEREAKLYPAVVISGFVIALGTLVVSAFKFLI